MANLRYTVIDGADSSLNKTSVLVTGETEALVVDAAFTRADGHRQAADRLPERGQHLRRGLQELERRRAGLGRHGRAALRRLLRDRP